MIEKFDPLKGEMLRILQPDGRLDKSLRPDLGDETIQSLYRHMVLIRLATRKPCPPAPGQAGYLCPGDRAGGRPAGAPTACRRLIGSSPPFGRPGSLPPRGPPAGHLPLLDGIRDGQKAPPGVNVFPISVPVGTHPLHAVGAGMRPNCRRKKSAPSPISETAPPRKGISTRP